MPRSKSYGEIAFDAYNDTFMPKNDLWLARWTNRGAATQEAWEAAGKAVAEAAKEEKE